MKIKRVREILDAEVITGEKFLESEVKMACGCDLMSHVLAHVKSDNTLLLTGLTTPQTIYTADAVDIKVICFVRGKKPDKEMIELAAERQMVLLATDLPMYESCGKLYKEGLIGCSEI
ncbi:MAG: hypothetical protein AB1765_11630 [Candidatus Hydrogenedentota bacterium]